MKAKKYEKKYDKIREKKMGERKKIDQSRKKTEDVNSWHLWPVAM